MANLASIANGNFTSSSSWGVIDATSFLDSEANNTALTTSYVASSNFTPGVITIDGIAIKIASRAVSPSGTISVNLRNTSLGADVTGTEVIIDVADIPLSTTTDNEGGWIFLKFSSPVLLLAATNYAVQAKTSNSSMVNLYRNATSNNWSRMLRTTTTQAPVAADVLHILGEHTGQGTGSNITITMNETATTDYGPGTDGLIALTINKRGTLTYGTSAATNYYLKLSGNAIVYNGGSLNIGSSGTPIPTDSTAILEFDPVADGGMGLIARNGSTVNMRGKTVTPYLFLAADASASATSLTLSAIPTGWKSGDTIFLGTTTRTQSQNETKTLSSDVTTTSAAIGAITNAHSGTSPTQGEVANLTRNVKVRSATSTLMAYVNIKSTGTNDIQYVEFYYVGTNTTTKRGVEIETTTGSTVFSNNSIHDVEGGGLTLSNAALNNITANSNVLHNCNTVAATSAISWSATTQTNITLDSNLVGSNGTGTGAVYTMADVGITFTNNRIAGGSSSGSSIGFSIAEIGEFPGFSGNVAHGMAGFPLWPGNTGGKTVLGSVTLWRNNQNGIRFETFVYGHFELKNLTCFGNSGNFQFIATPGLLVLRNANIYNEGGSFATTVGISPGSGKLIIIDSNIGGNGTHSSADIALGGNLSLVELINTTLGSSTKVSGQTSLIGCSYVRVHKLGGSSTAHQSYYMRGNIAADQTTRHTASGNSWKLTPNSASNKLIFPGPTTFDTFKVAVVANEARTISVYLQKDASYNGLQPRLVIVGGVIAGISTDQIASMTVGTGSWEQVSVTVTPTEDGAIEFYIDCDGTAGNVYADDVSIT